MVQNSSQNITSDIFTTKTSPSKTQDDDEDDEGVKAAVYARTSSVKNSCGYSLDEQVRRCCDRCEMMDWKIEYIFRDKAISGKDTERPMFQEMMDKAEIGLFDVVVFWKLDRFSRSLMNVVNIEKKLRSWDVALHSVTEQIDTTTPTGRFNFRNIASAAEFERELIRQRSKMGFQSLAAEHKWPNSTPPLGYDKNDQDKLEINEEEAELVREIFELYMEEKSMPQVAYILNNRDIETKNGDGWGQTSVGKVLRNRVYVGEYNVAHVNDYLEELQIVDDDTFERVTEIRNRFQEENETAGDSMGRDRKQSYVDNVLSQYKEYLEK